MKKSQTKYRENPLGKDEYFSVFSGMGEIPGDLVAEVHTAEVPWPKLFRESAGVEVVHVFMYRILRRDQCIGDEEIEAGEEIETLLWYVDISIRGIPNP
jgi:hypothetical protein